MIWNYWSLADLNKYLINIDKDLISRLEVTLFGLKADDFDPNCLHVKDNLTKIIEAFAPSDIFRDKEFRRYCLDRLPPEIIKDLAKNIGIDHDRNFDLLVDEISRASWDEGGFAQSFLNFFKLPPHFLAPLKDTPPDYIDLFPPSPQSPANIASIYKPLKDYQAQVFYDASEKLGIPRSRFIVQMPTGAGKTRTAMELVSSEINKLENNEIVVWLAHSEELCEQAFQCFVEVWQHVARKPLRAVRSWGSHPFPVSHDVCMFVVGGFQKFHSQFIKSSNSLEILRDRIRLIVVDEAHKAVAPTYNQVIRALITDKTVVVGLTATPGRTIMEETQELAKFFFQDLVGISTEDEQSPIAFLRKKKVLSKTEFTPLITSRKYVLTQSQRKKLENEFDFPKGFLALIGSDDIRNIEILKRMQKECAEQKRILFFGCSVEHSKFIAAMLFYLGFNVAHVDGTTDRNRRASIIDEFKSGKIQVLCNFGVLSTGFDAPNTDVVFISRPTNSAVLYSQMIGRGLRGPAIGGTPTCKIIDVRDNIVGFGDSDRVYRYFEEYWQ